jgi:hypothetical protein
MAPASDEEPQLDLRSCLFNKLDIEADDDVLTLLLLKEEGDDSVRDEETGVVGGLVRMETDVNSDESSSLVVASRPTVAAAASVAENKAVAELRWSSTRDDD